MIVIRTKEARFGKVFETLYPSCSIVREISFNFRFQFCAISDNGQVEGYRAGKNEGESLTFKNQSIFYLVQILIILRWWEEFVEVFLMSFETVSTQK